MYRYINVICLLDHRFVADVDKEFIISNILDQSWYHTAYLYVTQPNSRYLIISGKKIVVWTLDLNCYYFLILNQSLFKFHQFPLSFFTDENVYPNSCVKLRVPSKENPFGDFCFVHSSHVKKSCNYKLIVNILLII